MDPKNWSSPVKFETGIGTFRIVGTPEEASAVLLNHWPVAGGDKHLLARRACLDAVAGSIPAELARKAFIEACDEAGIYVME